MDMTAEEKQKLADTFDGWRHEIDLGDGVVTNGSEAALTKLKQKAWEMEKKWFKDKKVLDIGAWDGYFSFLAERWGASEVTAMDIAPSPGFDIAKRILKSKVKYVIKDLIDATPENLGVFDTIIFGGVLYHMKFPFLSLHRVANLMKSGGNLVLETHSPQQLNKGEFADLPLMFFYPNDEFSKDESNWCGPNICCIEHWLDKTGFEVDKIIYSQGPDRYVFHATRTNKKIELECEDVRINRSNNAVHQPKIVLS